jgi:RNase P subunit RPR2
MTDPQRNRCPYCKSANYRLQQYVDHVKLHCNACGRKSRFERKTEKDDDR